MRGILGDDQLKRFHLEFPLTLFKAFAIYTLKRKSPRPGSCRTPWHCASRAHKTATFVFGAYIAYDLTVPTISSFFGIVVQMFWREHAPPHFHALYAEFEVEIDIRTLEVIKGSLPRRALALVLEWAVLHRAELMEDWNLCQSKQPPKRIEPLE
jgi:hypothetical protein